jgi:hypothetical protein
MKIHPRRLLQPILLLAVAAACGPSSVATVSPTPSSPAVFDEGFGFLVGNTVRRESDPQPLFTLNVPSEAGGVVSPDGRRLAFWAENELRVIDIAANAQPRTLLSITGKEDALYFAWSTDSTGIVVGVNGLPAVPAADAPPAYTKLRVVDVAGGQPRDVIRIANVNVLPLTWDRQAHLITGYMPSSSGARAYYVVDESGKLKSTTGLPGYYIVEASQDGRYIVGRGKPEIPMRAWPVDSYEHGINFTAAADEQIATAAWRPGTSEVAILLHTDQLVLWDANGTRHAVPLPAAPQSSDRYASLTFRVDGKAVVVSRQSGAETNPETYAVAVDLASGRTTVVEWTGGASVRLG